MPSFRAQSIRLGPEAAQLPHSQKEPQERLPQWRRKDGGAVGVLSSLFRGSKGPSACCKGRRGDDGHGGSAAASAGGDVRSAPAAWLAGPATPASPAENQTH